MDITNIPQNLIKALEQKNTEQLAVLSRVLNLIVGKTVIASVASTAPVTAAEREELLKQTVTALSQLSQQSVEKLTPAIKTEIARLMQQQNLIQSPELKWINLVVNNRALLTYSDRPLTAGQTIPVQLQSPQKLVLLDLPELDPNKAAPGKSQTTPVVTTPTSSSPAGASNNSAGINKIIETTETIKIEAIKTNESTEKNTTTTNKPAGTLNSSTTNNPTTTNPARTSNLAEPTSLANTTSLTETKNAIAVNELLKSAIAELTNKTTTTSANPTKNIVAATANIIPSKPSTLDAISNKDIQEKTITPNTSIPTTNTHNKPTQQHKVNIYSENDLSLKRTSQTENKHNTPETTAAKSLISEQLRNILPHRDTPNVLLSAVMQLQHLPASTRAQLLSPNLEQALKSLAEKIRSPEQLLQPKILAQTLKNSGVFFENKLNYLALKDNIDKHSTNTNTNTNTNTKLNNDGSHSNNGKINNTYAQDLKGSLLTLLNRVTQELSGSNKPVTSEQTLKLFQNLGGAIFNQPPGASPIINNKTDITQNIGLLIQELMHKPVKELSNKELRTQLLVLLQQHSVHSLAKIQLQQLHNVNHELETKDTNATNASWQLEIPVKHHNDVQHVHLRIDREWIDEKHETESEKSTNKIKQWSVTLRFDLPTLGEFCAQLAIVNTQVSATLWAAREKTFTEVREQIEGLRKQLESEGINVKYLQCMRGMPPQKPMALSYSLIDIST